MASHIVSFHYVMQEFLSLVLFLCSLIMISICPETISLADSSAINGEMETLRLLRAREIEDLTEIGTDA